MTTLSSALNATDVANMLHIGRNAVYELAKCGELPSYKMGRKLLFTLADVNAYLESKQQNAGKPAPSDPLADTPLTPPALLSGNEPFLLAGEGAACAAAASFAQQMGIPLEQKISCDFAALTQLYEGAVAAAVVSLFDFRTNGFNTPFIQRLVPGTSVISFRLVTQQAGFIVAYGNPKRLSTWSSLFRESTRIANRKRGTMERILLDEKAISLEYLPAYITGYTTEAPSAYEAAALVDAGLADACIGTAATARLFKNVQFVPLQTVATDLVVAKTEQTRPLIRALKTALINPAGSQAFESALPCDTANLGSVVFEC